MLASGSVYFSHHLRYIPLVRGARGVSLEAGARPQGVRVAGRRLRRGARGVSLEAKARPQGVRLMRAAGSKSEQAEGMRPAARGGYPKWSE